MWYITVLRLSAVIFAGILAYFILLWAIGRKVPGRLKKRSVSQNYKSAEKMTGFFLIYLILLLFLIVTGYIVIKSFTGGDL